MSAAPTTSLPLGQHADPQGRPAARSRSIHVRGRPAGGRRTGSRSCRTRRAATHGSRDRAGASRAQAAMRPVHRVPAPPAGAARRGPLKPLDQVVGGEHDVEGPLPTSAPRAARWTRPPRPRPATPARRAASASASGAGIPGQHSTRSAVMPGAGWWVRCTSSTARSRSGQSAGGAASTGTYRSSSGTSKPPSPATIARSIAGSVETL